MGKGKKKGERKERLNRVALLLLQAERYGYAISTAALREAMYGTADVVTPHARGAK